MLYVTRHIVPERYDCVNVGKVAQGMSLNSFIPQLWSARLLENLKNNLVYAQPGVVNRDYEGEIRGQGSSVRINAVGKVSVGDYGKNANIGDPEELSDASTVLVIEKARYFNFQVDDVDAIQQQPKVMDTAMTEAAYALTNDLDQYVASAMATGGTAGASLGTTGSPISVGTAVSDKNAYETLVDLSVLLDAANVPVDLRFATVPPWFYGMLLKDSRFVSFGTPQNVGSLRNAEIGQAAGLSVLKSNNVPNTSATAYKIIASHPFATTVAMQANQVEAYRPQARFADAVKGLMLYGAKVIRPSCVIVATCNRGT